MSYKVRIDSFEGPFDLLLYLVSRQKVDIGAISITEIADQYLAEVSRMGELDLDVASDFLLVASTLLQIKAESLIPRDRADVDEEIAELAPSEARDILVERLVEYKKYKNAAAALHARFVGEGRMHTRPFGPDADFLRLVPDFLAGVTVDSLALLAASAMAPARVGAHRGEADTGRGARARHPSAYRVARAFEVLRFGERCDTSRGGRGDVFGCSRALQAPDGAS